MRKKLAMVVLGLSLAVGAPAANDLFPATAAQTVEAAVQTGWVKESGNWYFYKDGTKQTGWQTWDGKRYYLNADGTMKANEWMNRSITSGAGAALIRAARRELMEEAIRLMTTARCRDLSGS